MKKRDPRRDPQAGDRLAKVVTDRRGVRAVKSRTVIRMNPAIIVYTPKRVECLCTLAQWRAWAKNARVCPPT